MNMVALKILPNFILTLYIFLDIDYTVIKSTYTSMLHIENGEVFLA